MRWSSDGSVRALAALPWSDNQPSADAKAFFDRMADLDERIARRRRHETVLRKSQVNAHRKCRLPFIPGDYVWLLRPRGVASPKLESWWLGPYRVEARVGENSYQIYIPQ